MADVKLRNDERNRSKKFYRDRILFLILVASIFYFLKINYDFSYREFFFR